jgi:hypothetical protein
MADVTCKNTGRKFYQVDGATVALLMELLPGKLEYLQRDLTHMPGNVAVPRKASSWGFATSRVSGQVIGLAIRLPGGEELAVTGPAHDILARCQHALAGRKVELPSDELIRQYAAITQPVDTDVIMEKVRMQRLRLEEQQQDQNRQTLPAVQAQIISDAQNGGQQ